MASLGQQLKKAREERGVTIHDIAAATHLGARFLQAIENDDYKILPGGVFNRAFVRKFARHVGMDEEQAVRLYEEQLRESGGEPEKSSYLGLGDEMEAKASSGNSALLTGILIVLLGAIGAAVYLAFFRGSDELSPAPALVSTPTPQPTATPTPVESPGASPSPTATPTPEPISGLRLQITATQDDCWVSFRADGGKNEQVTIAKGETREFLADEKISFIRFGNLPTLNILANGRKLSIEKLAPNRKGLVVDNVVISKDNYQGFIE
ncbi:MAG: helix-turn-helix domain-containing protein [Acidobacteria bacterium]|nr:helix-turn-helix domain-containing protein [Acidobacteriota bacterium]